MHQGKKLDSHSIGSIKTQISFEGGFENVDC